MYVQRYLLIYSLLILIIVNILPRFIYAPIAA